MQESRGPAPVWERWEDRLEDHAPYRGWTQGNRRGSIVRPGGDSLPTVRMRQNSDMAEGTHILTTGEAAQLCGVSRSTLRRAVAQGQLRSWHTPGMHLRFSVEDCLEFAMSLGRVDVELVGRRYEPAAGRDPQASRVHQVDGARGA